MRVLILARGYPTNKYKTNGIFEYDQAKAIAQAGNEVILAAIDMRSIRRWRKWGFESIYKDGVYIEVLNIPCGRMPRLILNIVKQVSLAKLYSKIFYKYGKPELIHTHFISLGYTAIKVFNNSDIPLVHTEHYSGMNQKKLNRYHKYLGDKTYKYMDNVIAVSEYLANNIRNNFKVDVEVIPNIVDTSFFEYSQHQEDKNSFVFLTVGSLTKNKRMDLLIESFYTSFKNKANVELIIYGDGPERQQLSRQIADLNMSKQIFLMGLVDRIAIAEKMKRSNCFVLVSKSETFGVVLIEALASGLPIISTKCGGPEDIINEKNGILVDDDSIKGISKVLTEMYYSAKHYDTKEISKKAIERYGSANISKAIIDVYNRTIKKRFKVGYHD